MTTDVLRAPTIAPATATAPKLKVRIFGITKRYGSVLAVDDVSLDVRDGEFLTLLGPSGSGKTTILMILAGLVPTTSGRVLIDDSDATMKPPYHRDMGVVFQNYALFPHMTVYENIAFPLRMRHVNDAEASRRVSEALELVRLPQVSTRLPRQLSGGQQQRVALARALVFRPSVLLMDEPLGALDRKLREQMQYEIRRIQRTLGITAVYVTHDQVEALVMSDRIAIMSEGRIQQLDTPAGVYERPATGFVASFLGESNILHGTLVSVDHGRTVVEVGDAANRGGPRWSLALADPIGLSPGEQVSVAIRPERMMLVTGDRPISQENSVQGTVDDVTYVGDSMRYRVRTSDGGSLIVRQGNDHAAVRHAPGDRVTLAWFAADTVALRPG